LIFFFLGAGVNTSDLGTGKRKKEERIGNNQKNKKGKGGRLKK
jgi:hypothetical protein